MVYTAVPGAYNIFLLFLIKVEKQ